jgi:hypothetical protein
MARHRRSVGINFFLSGAYGCAIWRWRGSHGDPFNDFDGREARAAEPADQLLAYPEMKKNNDWKSYIGPIPTIAWESIREGINDYKYLYLLSEEINKSLNTKNTQLQKYVQRISYTLKELEKINKGRKNPLNPTNWNTEELEGIREWAANSIIKLRSFTGKTQKMDDRGLSDDETNDLKRKMSFRVVPLVDVSPHHRFWLTTPSFTSIPLVDRSPAIDGDLTDDAWKDASMISIPCSAKTTVRLMRDEKNFYFAWNCCEPYLKKLMPQSKNEDKGPIWIQDSVELFLAPFEKRKQCAHLMINHLGRMATECGHAKWQPLMINVATAKNKTGYTVELSLSIAELKALYPSDWTDFAINFCRVRTVNASLYDGCLNFNWAYATGGFHQPDKYGIAAYNNNVIIKNMNWNFLLPQKIEQFCIKCMFAKKKNVGYRLYRTIFFHSIDLKH